MSPGSQQRRSLTRGSRRGMSMIEFIVGMIMLAIVGLAMTRVLSSQARYFDHQKNGNLARSVARGPLNRVVSDLRMVEALGGVIEASETAILARIPYAIGIVCETVGGFTHLSLLPVDSAMYAAPGFSGYAWRSGQGTYEYIENGPAVSAGDSAVCEAAQILTLTAEKAKIIRITPALTDTASVATPVLLFRRIRYEFAASAAVPGTVGLFRTVVETGETEELSAPYANTARFRFYVGSVQTAQDAPPADLATIRGIEMILDGLSEKIPTGKTQRASAPFTTAVFFKNRLD